MAAYGRFDCTLKSSCYDIINIMHYSLKGGTIAVLSVMERPFFFAGAIFSAPSIKVEANPCTVIYYSTSYK